MTGGGAENLSEWYDSQKKLNSNLCKLLQERMDKANPRRKLTADETNRLNKLGAIAARLKRRKNVQSDGRVTHYLHTYYGVVISV